MASLPSLLFLEAEFALTFTEKYILGDFVSPTPLFITDFILFVIEFIFNEVLHLLSVPWASDGLWSLWSSLFFFKNSYISAFTPCLVKLLSPSITYSAGSILTCNLSWKQVTALILQTLILPWFSVLLKLFITILSGKVPKHLSTHNLSDHRYRFHKGLSAGSPAFLGESWSFSFGEYFVVFFLVDLLLLW